MIVIATGGRFFDNYPLVLTHLITAHQFQPVTLLIHGACQVWDKEKRRFVNSGLDWQADDAAKELGIPTLPVPAPWGTLGKAAGSARNKQMALIALERKKIVAIEKREPEQSVLCMAFEGGTGTANMVQHARRASIVCWETWKEPFPSYRFGLFGG